MGSTPIPITSECFCFSPSCSQLIDSSRNLSGACCRAEQLGAACPMVRRLFCMQVIGVRFPGGPLAGSILDTCNPMECNGRIPCFRKVAGYGLSGRSAKSFVARVTWDHGTKSKWHLMTTLATYRFMRYGVHFSIACRVCWLT